MLFSSCVRFSLLTFLGLATAIVPSGEASARLSSTPLPAGPIPFKESLLLNPFCKIRDKNNICVLDHLSASLFHFHLGKEKSFFKPTEMTQKIFQEHSRNIMAFYAERKYQPVWIQGHNWTEAAKSLFARLKKAPEDGLNLGGYLSTYLQKDPATLRTSSELAALEIHFSQILALYAYQASGGRREAFPIPSSNLPHAKFIQAHEALHALAASSNPSETLSNFNPPHEGYQHLRKKLIQLLHHAPSINSKNMDSTQRKELLAEVIINMERWRALPRSLGDYYVRINIPEYTLKLYHRNTFLYESRIIVGRPSNPTPIFSDHLKAIVINPYWYVPTSILRKELLPKLARQPNYLRKNRYEMVHNTIRQLPGARNALGQIKFVFPNMYSVYLHDTPNHTLFSQKDRAFSHGCIRVDHPFKLAYWLLREVSAYWTEEKIHQLVGKKEHAIPLPRPPSIHLTYFTLSVEEDGTIQHYPDIYKLSPALKKALSL